jgi:hypothetical protein
MALHFQYNQNSVGYMTGTLLPLFNEFIDTAQLNVLAGVSTRYAGAFGANLDDVTYGILKSIQDQEWEIKIKAQDGFLTHLYMRLKDSTHAQAYTSIHNAHTQEMTQSAIPDEICQLTTLKELVIRCGFRGHVLGGLPENIGKLTNLEVLDARKTGITTKLPKSMVYMFNLRVLDLRGNDVIEDVPRAWLCCNAAARIIQNAWRSKENKAVRIIQHVWRTSKGLKEESGEILGPLRNCRSRIDIWERAGFRGYPTTHVGSILNMPCDELKTPYMWVADDDCILKGPEEGVWLREPLLMRSMAIIPVKMWYGIEFV